jgi:hypothetical protein
MIEEIRKNIHIKILEYAQERVEFTISQLMHDLKFNHNEKNLFCQYLIHDKVLFQNTGRNKKISGGEESIFTISTEGRFKLLEYEQLENAKELGVQAIKESSQTLKITVFSVGLAIFSIILTIVALALTYFSLQKAQQSLELSTNPEMIIESGGTNSNSADLGWPGNFIATSSKANLILKNNFLGDITEVDLRMVLLEMHLSPTSSNPVICPVSYIDYTSNPEFIIRENPRVSSILDNKKFSLKSGGRYDFFINYKNIEKDIETLNGYNFFIKIDVAYKRKIDNRSFNYSKIYRILSLTTLSDNNKETKKGFLVDTDIDRETVVYAAKKSQRLSDTDYMIFPFRKKEFVETIKSKFVPPYLVDSSECEYFELDKKINSIE